MAFPATDKSRLFLSELAQFYRSKGQLGVTPQHLVARLNGQEVDLWQLYSAVLDMGGSYRVNQQSQWDEVHARLFGRPDAAVGEENHSSRRSLIGVNVSVALRQIYQRYLMPYERVHYSNFASDVADEEDDDSRPNFTSSATGSSSNKDALAASFVIHSSLTQPHPPQKHAHHVDPLTRLFCALVSGLANEMEFGLRVVTMLSNSRQIDAIADFKLVDVLLECCSLSLCHCRKSNDQQSARLPQPRSNVQQKPLPKKCFCFSRFWSKMCKDESIAALLLEVVPEDCISVSSDDDDEQEQQMVEKVKRVADLIRTITESIQEYQEVDEETADEAAPLRLIQFASLLLASDDSEFKAMALEIISNINLIGSQSRDEECYATLVNFIVCHCISLVVEHSDVAIVRRSIRTLAHVAAMTADEPDSAFGHFIDNSLINRLIELLTCQQDVTLLTLTLEFCWTISEKRPKLLTSKGSSVNQLLKILINLLNCDVNTHFTPPALKQVRVCDTRSRSQVRPAAASQAVSTQPTSQQTVRLALQPASASNTSTSSNLAIVTESESFAIAWLKGLFESSSSRTQPISISEMYTDYIRTSCKNGRKNVVGAQSFSQIISRTFPSATIASTHVEGISLRPITPRKTQNQPVQGQLTSPILKAHLCAPPKTSPTPAPTATSLTNSTANSITTTTTLIKSLLANKLRSNSQTNSQKTESQPEAAGHESKAVPAETLSSHPVPVSAAAAHVVSNQQNVFSSSSPQSVLISTSSASGSGLPGQGPQQFLLVRTIIQPGSGANQSGMRLILPASAVYSPQRPTAPIAVASVNGNGVATSPPAAGQSNDILLKAVLGSGIVSDASHSSNADSPKNCVKSSPLLNVLLDKGKFPESSAAAMPSATSSVTQPHDRVYILTTGSPIKSVNHCDSGPLRNGTSNENTNSSPVVGIKLKPSATVINCHTDSILTNGDICVPNQSDEKKCNSLPIADLSPIKDMQKAVDDAPKLIAKRPSDESTRTPVKKSKPEEGTNNTDVPKVVTKIQPVNGEIKIPPKASPEKVQPSDDSLTTDSAPTASVTPAVLGYLCEWNECKRTFTHPSLVFKHVYESHVFAAGGAPPKHCLWGGPEGMGPGCLSERPQLSLLTHLQDFHCSPSILQQAALKRQQFGGAIAPPPGVPVPAPPAHPGYAQNAALLAIRRLNCIEPFSLPAATPTTPITVSIRLTAALIIRNLATVSSDARRCLQRYERHLSELCVCPGRDESRTIAQCLALIQNVVWRR